MIATFQHLLGSESAWEVGPGGEVDRELGVQAAIAVAPEDERQCAAVLLKAAELRLKVVPWGCGQHQRLGNLPEQVDLVLVTTNMSGIVAHDVADQTIVARAGTRLADLLQVTRDAGQLLPLDPPGSARATIGGVVASGVAGPLRTGYGNARDFLLGTLAAHPDGKLSRSGGRLVKNVTGFDLHRLYHGSMGALAVLCEINLRLRPWPECDQSLLIGFDELESFDRFLVEFRRSGSGPVAFTLVDARSLSREDLPLPELDPDGRYIAGLRFHGTGSGVERELARCLGLRQESGAEWAAVVAGREQALFWAAVRERIPGYDLDRVGAVCKLALLPIIEGSSVLGGAIESLVAVCAGAGLESVVVAEPALGLVRLGLPLPPTEELLIELTRLTGADGQQRFSVETSPAAWRRSRDLFPNEPAGAGTARSIKQALDVGGVLSPGRLFRGGSE